MDFDFNTALGLLKQEAWLPLGILIVGYFVRLFADDTKIPAAIPKHWQSTVIAALGWFYGLLLALPDWKKGLAPGMLVVVVTLAIRAYYTNRPEPGWLKLLALVEKKKDDAGQSIPVVVDSTDFKKEKS